MKRTSRSSVRSFLIVVAVVVAVGPIGNGLSTAAAATAGDTEHSFSEEPVLAPDPARSDAVLRRGSLLRRVAALQDARRTLRLRGSAVGDSLVMIASELASVQRQLDSERAAALLTVTDDFGLGVAVFPVDELRRMFHNDWNEPRSGGRRHRGTDLLAEFGVPIRAIEDGTIERISTGSLGGNALYLNGASGSRYYYAHLGEFADIVEGQKILAGDLIGTIGDSGNARGTPHLHIQWDPSGESDWRNPHPLLEALFEDEYGSPPSSTPTPDLPATPRGLT